MLSPEQLKLRDHRRRHNIPQRELALAVGLSQTSISSYEISRPPSPGRMMQLLQTIEELAGQKNRPDLRIQ